MRGTSVALCLPFLFAIVPPARAQLLNGGAAVVYGHHHLNVSSIDAHMKFWVGALGGKAITIGVPPMNVIEFPNVFVFLSLQPPTGGTKGTTVNHVAFEVPSLRAVLDKVKAAGFPVVTRAELPAQYEVKDDIGYVTGLDHYVAFVMGPDETKVEFLEEKGMTRPIELHHIHFAALDVQAMKSWYVTTFNARSANRGPFEAADLPGVNLTFSAATAPIVGTAGRALDHIGFEVRDLEDFCLQLDSMNVKFEREYAKSAALGLASAVIVDPWGTRIELTEGLGRIK